MSTLLEQPVQYLRGVGPARAGQLARLGITRIGDLLEHFPRRYEETAGTVCAAEAARAVGSLCRVRGNVLDAAGHRPRRGLHITRCLIGDSTGTLLAVWFNQPYLLDRLQPGRPVTLTGRVERRRGRVQLLNPEFQEGHPDTAAGALLPVYPATAGLSQRWLRLAVGRALEQYGDRLDDPLPAELTRRRRLPDRAWAVRQIHFPGSSEELHRARRRLAFEELFVLQAALALLHRGVTEETAGFRHRLPAETWDAFLRSLPFEPTRAQRRVMDEVLADLAAPRPMHRLVQGDVGSGKTLVAAAALLAAAAAGSQAAMMAPTEILAEQHFQHLAAMLAPAGVTVALLVGSTPARAREPVLAGLADGSVQVVVGTHALLEEAVAFRRLGLVVTDEQHRFGVRQRARLQAKSVHPDVLVMTATPIPRTLALTLYGDLDLSVIDELPPGRRPVKTRWLPTARRAEAYGTLRRETRQGRQCYVVCPVIEESADRDLKAAADLYRRLQRHLPEVPLGLLHGRLAAEEKHRVMAAFRDGRIAVLVATTVVEVGVDVPNATLMIVEDADRFGLAQLHQLRGRGRGRHGGTCILLADPSTPEGRERMRAMEETTDGFVIAEKDLQLRGPGEFFGTRQHGLPELRVAHPVRDIDLLEAAQQEARRLIAADPRLERPGHQALRRALLERYREQIELALVG